MNFGSKNLMQADKSLLSKGKPALVAVSNIYVAGGIYEKRVPVMNMTNDLPLLVTSAASSYFKETTNDLLFPVGVQAKIPQNFRYSICSGINYSTATYIGENTGVVYDYRPLAVRFLSQMASELAVNTAVP